MQDIETPGQLTAALLVKQREDFVAKLRLEDAAIVARRKEIAAELKLVGAVRTRKTKGAAQPKERKPRPPKASTGAATV